MEDIIFKMIKEAPLKSRIRVSNEMAFINLLSALSYRKDKMWTDDENELLVRLLDLAENHTNEILKEFKEWEQDGKPE